ncbi:hypothetical protein BDZ94DRAFT_1322142 [Collybia nuda]|uniref:Uncharacterized protein n=1 Tax=Collybia nuda TaxID=64659 RepID=A0A9P5Y7B7_9AGAR|nr:hypothetical protein BDZ94DRAFT_1322142 [Collybia nuda]
MVSVLTATYQVAAIIQSVTDEARRLPSLGKMSLKNRKLFAVDLTLVALAIRTGYLVDTVAPRDAVDVFSRLLSALRIVHPVFGTVIHVYEPTSGQSLFVNISMFLGNQILEGISSARSENRGHQDYGHEANVFEISFVRLHPDQRCEFLSAPPAGVISILKSLVDEFANVLSLPVSKTLPKTFSQDISVPLAAVLIEYPVAYVPMLSDQAPFLTGVNLDVYECVLTSDGSLQSSNPHTLLKFSSPSQLGKEHPDLLGPSHMIESLIAKFQPRVHKISSDTKLVVRQTVEIVDRVAL